MDIERSEWDSLPNIMADGILNKVKQLGLEIHINTGTVTGFRWRMNHLKKLEKLPFRKWYSKKKPGCTRRSREGKVPISKCIEMVYINTNPLCDCSNVYVRLMLCICVYKWLLLGNKNNTSGRFLYCDCMQYRGLLY